ncbi:class I adenylate-forming enzyme family protein [Pseudohoeflea coraliihabitans]|uniref:AMP-binding protein n=1 Tax=Pseudohoeflea coraliihabitans TaxID=2860393 RepID=A0ABS6WSR4_9HYPH|nr:AMP-binding protein [Pseudohoeflea sp. DP4N28-3]MBW3098993.1 AMP-binding protein [Pseudohoeflea sp. DP4N28-3]
MNLAEWLVRTARRVPDAPALLSGETVVATYCEFARNAARIGGFLRAHHKVEPGDRVAIFMKNSTAYLELLYGIWFAGAVAVPINAKLHPREAAFIVEDSGSKVLFVSGADALRLSLPSTCTVHDLEAEPAFDAESKALAAPEPRAPDDLAWLFYTSGTTGKPKGVMLTNANLHAMTYAYFVDVDDVLAEDAAVYAAPLSHGAGLYNFMHVLRGSRHVVPLSAGFDAMELCALAPRLGSVTLFAAPTMISRWLAAARQSGYSGEGLRTITYGGGPMYLADIEAAVAQFGPRFVQIYGQGECPMTITSLPRADIEDRAQPRWRERLASVGPAQSCVSVRVVDADGTELPAGEIGEIVVSGAPVMKGYWNNPEATAHSIRDGWLWTGDMGTLDEDGYLTLRDRSKDVIISGGTNIYPREVEEALLMHPAVSEVSVVGRPSSEWGEEVVAFIVASSKEPPSPDELDAHCRSLIAGFKRPRDYIFETALPKNNYGKVLKTELRARVSHSV